MNNQLARKAATQSFPSSQQCSRGTTSAWNGLRIRRQFVHPKFTRATHDTTTKSSDSPPSFTPQFSLLENEIAAARDAHHVRVWPFSRMPVRQLWKKELYDPFDESLSPPIAAMSYGDVVMSEFPKVPMEDSQNLERLLAALREGYPPMVLSALIRLVRYDGKEYFDTLPLRSLPATMFSGILRCIHPKYFLDRHAQVLSELTRSGATLMGMPVHESYAFIPIFLSQIKGVMAARALSFPMSVTDYKHLLTCARAAGRKDTADLIWAEMKERGVAPDIDCYNQYIATKCWGEMMNPSHRYMVRVTQGCLWLWADERRRMYKFQGRTVGKSGIKIEVANLIRSMAKVGISGNEETFCLLMTGLSREGDIRGVESVLKITWGVNVMAVMSEETPPKPKPLAKSSQLYPTGQLMFTLAHIYGTNNAIQKAMRLLDYFSRHYAIDIPMKAWEELLERTYMLSVRQRQRARMNPFWGNLDGQLPENAVTALWETITSEPYNVKPTMYMYNKHILKLIGSNKFTYSRQLMEEALHKHRAVVAILSHKIQDRTLNLLQGSPTDIHKITSDIQFLRFRVRRNRLYIRNWVGALIKKMNRRLWKDYRYRTVDLPNIIKYWELFLPHRIKNISTPFAQFTFTTHAGKINASRQAFMGSAQENGVLPGKLMNQSQRRRLLFRKREVARLKAKEQGVKLLRRSRDIDRIAEDEETRDLLLYAENGVDVPVKEVSVQM